MVTDDTEKSGLKNIYASNFSIKDGICYQSNCIFAVVNFPSQVRYTKHLLHIKCINLIQYTRMELLNDMTIGLNNDCWCYTLQRQ